MMMPTFSEGWKSSWSNIDATDAPESFIAYSDLSRDAGDDNPEEYAELLAHLPLKQGMYILDVGCGTGGLARLLARRVGTSGRVIGVDKSSTMVDAAASRYDSGDLPLTILLADSTALPFDATSFDLVVSTGVFSILDQPQMSLTEMVRVLKSSGTLGISCIEGSLLCLDALDAALTQRIVAYTANHEINGFIGRQLPRLFREQGLHHIQTQVSHEIATHYTPAIQQWSEVLAHNASKAQSITPDEAQRWLSELNQTAEQGSFFRMNTFFHVSGQKP
jgi:ubiquinone/menaquinone biosynthesis C-methylase UbiE